MLHEAALTSVKPNKPVGQHKSKQVTPSSGPKKAKHTKKKKQFVKKGGQPSSKHDSSIILIKLSN